ncbi:rod shape-determining protein MreD [Sphingomonas palmae]|uniref:Rod shape-determining protein MreD n=1 Tax=Sphingomonas palmae TaxID=1855283 RepID=A0A1H7FQ60_9SPHN|nr:rod shape-determining protein MreD [Sphingomonas palmae]SEK26602.1 rod shape-determining protein MreD [Sphingomonas palmae]
MPAAEPLFREPLPLGSARLLPWTTVMAGSLLTIVPVGATLSLLPPFGLLVLLSWRLLAPFAIRLWAPAALGLFDDIVSGQPIGSAMLLWTLAYFLVGAMEARSGLRDFWQNWAIAAAAIALCLIGGRLVATPLSAHVEVALGFQIMLSVLIFPAVAFLIGRVDARRAR